MINAKRTRNIGTIKIGNQEYDVFLAKSEDQKRQGLQNFSELPKGEGMLFYINETEPEETLFHMHNVPFPIDMIFLDDEFKVLDVKNAKPEEDNIRGIASYVLEVNAGSEIKKGDEAELDDEDTHEYTMKILGSDNKPQGYLIGGERIISRRETIVLLRKVLKANASKEDKDYKALGKYIFKVFKGQDTREPEYVSAPESKK